MNGFTCQFIAKVPLALGRGTNGLVQNEEVRRVLLLRYRGVDVARVYKIERERCMWYLQVYGIQLS